MKRSVCLFCFIIALVKYIFFVLTFIYLTNWQAVIALFKGAFFSKRKSLSYKNGWLFNLLKKKTGIRFKFKKAILKNYTAFSLILPPNTIVFSSRILKDFNKDELQWISLHEAGHRVYYHGIKYIPTSFIFVTSGMLILNYYNNPIVNFLTVAFSLTPIYQQIIRIFETQADQFAAKNMDNPEGMITANKKFGKTIKSRIYKSDILRTLFTPHLSYNQRIKLAKKEIESRKKKI